jgi:hypothetical protein
MTAATILFAVAMSGTPVALVLLWLWLDELLADREDRRRRVQQDRQVDAEWFALLAATETTPIYDELVCEQIEKAEGWS